MSEASVGWGVGLQNRKVSCRAGLCATLACSVFAGLVPQGARAQGLPLVIVVGAVAALAAALDG